MTDYTSAIAPTPDTTGQIVYLVWWTGVYEDELRAIYLAREAAEQHAAMDPDCSVEERPVLASPLPKATAKEKRR